MANWFKKSLGLLSAGMAATMVSTAVVSCSAVSFDAILNRTVSTNTYVGTYTSNVSSWNTAHSMQGTDATIWANVFDTFLSSDQYGRIYGSLAISEYGQEKNQDDKNYRYVGNVNETSDEWTYALRQMNWVNNSGNIIDGGENASVIEGLRQAAWYALSPTNGSDVTSLWTSFIQGAQEIYNALSAAYARLNAEDGAVNKINRTEYDRLVAIEKSKIFEDNDPETFGINPGKDGDIDTITFKLKKSAPYFESLLTYSVFSPIYNAENGMITDYRRTPYNGAYYVEQANPNGRIVLRKNENYVLKDSTNIETIEFNYLEDGTASRLRTLFESGSSTGFDLSASDLKGWNSYIGIGKEKYEDPTFESMYSYESPDKLYSFMLVNNYYNTDMDDLSLTPTERKRANSASKLLQSEDVRAFMSTSINRSEFGRFYSKTIDEIGQTSQSIRNTFTAEGTAADENSIDYTKYVTQEYDKSFETANANLPLGKSTTLADGQDAYYGKSVELVGKTQDQLIENINKFIELNDITKTKTNLGDRVQLTLIQSPTTNNSSNPYINMMVKAFNHIENNPIYIQTKVPASNDEFRTAQASGHTDLLVSAWSPDYKDPSSYLETMTLTGAYGSYNGFVRIFPQKTGSNDDAGDSGYNINQNVLTVGLDGTTNNTAKMRDLLETYSVNFKDADDNKIIGSERFPAFAELEVDFFYKNFFSFVFFTRSLPKIWTVNFQTPYTKSYEAAGLGQYKLYNTTIDARLGTAAYYNEATARYATEKKEVLEDWNNHRTSAHWSKSTNYSK